MTTTTTTPYTYELHAAFRRHRHPNTLLEHYCDRRQQQPPPSHTNIYTHTRRHKTKPNQNIHTQPLHHTNTIPPHATHTHTHHPHSQLRHKATTTRLASLTHSHSPSLCRLNTTTATNYILVWRLMLYSMPKHTLLPCCKVAGAIRNAARTPKHMTLAHSDDAHHKNSRMQIANMCVYVRACIYYMVSPPTSNQKHLSEHTKPTPTHTREYHPNMDTTVAQTQTPSKSALNFRQGVHIWAGVNAFVVVFFVCVFVPFECSATVRWALSGWVLVFLYSLCSNFLAVAMFCGCLVVDTGWCWCLNNDFNCVSSVGDNVGRTAANAVHLPLLVRCERMRELCKG